MREIIYSKPMWDKFCVFYFRLSAYPLKIEELMYTFKRTIQVWQTFWDKPLVVVYVYYVKHQASL